MREKEEVHLHLQEVGYNKLERERIMGFLLGYGIIEKGEIVKFKGGDSSFDEFYAWFNNAIDEGTEMSADTLKELSDELCNMCKKVAINGVINKALNDIEEILNIDADTPKEYHLPKYGISDKVVITNEHPQYTWEIKDVKFHERSDKSKKGHFRYLLSRDGAEKWVKQSKIELFEEKEESKPKPKFLVGDWVRVTDSEQRYQYYMPMLNKMNIPYKKEGNLVVVPYGKVFQIEIHETMPSDGYLYGIEYDGERMLIGENGIEPYLPKEGEFFVTTINNTFIAYCKGVVDKEANNLSVKYWTCPYNHVICAHKGGTSDGKHRPATEEEKRQLIKEVEKRFGVTYCDEKKDWFELTPSQIIKKGGKVKVSFRDGSIIIGSCVMFDNDNIVFDNGICITEYGNVTKVEIV